MVAVSSPSFTSSAAVAGLASAFGLETGSANWSHAISCPSGAHDVSCFSVKLIFSQYSTPGCASIFGIGSVNSFSSRGAISSAGSLPLATVRPSAFTSHVPCARSLGLVKSNQFFTLMRPSARSTAETCRFR